MDPASLAATFSSGRDMSLSGGKADLGDQKVSQGFGGFGNTGGGLTIIGGSVKDLMPNGGGFDVNQAVLIGGGIVAAVLLVVAFKKG